MLQLRAYQIDIIERARAFIREGVEAILIQAPTGSGKTSLTAHMLRHASARGYRTWFVCHRREIIKQAVSTLTEAANLNVGIVAAGFPSNRKPLCQVCSIGTLRQRRHLLLPPSLIVWDEAHHTAARTWAQIFHAYPNAAHIGLTATPERLDGTGLGLYFKELVPGPSVASLISEGYLSRYKLFAPPPPDLSSVHMIGGDYNKRELAAAMNKSTVTGDVLSHYRRHAAGKRMVLFAWSIEASKDLAEKFRSAGIPAAHVDGDTDNATRDAVMDQFRRGEILVITNVDLFGEGLDVPGIEAVALLRPTQSLGLYLQQVGRALRPAPGKDFAIVLDHAGNCRRFGLPDDERAWTLEGRRHGRARDDAAPIRQCPMCYGVMSVALDACKFCGFKFIASPREIEEVEGTLEEISVERQRFERLREQTEARSLDDLIKIGRLRGYKAPERWAHHVFKARAAKEAARQALGFATGRAPEQHGLI